jgi:hypothetical protein
MNKARIDRDQQSQLGQFFTPVETAQKIVDSLSLTTKSVVLEPSAGDGSFLIPLILRFMKLHSGTHIERLTKTLTKNIFSVELDTVAYKKSLEQLEKIFGSLPKNHNIMCNDFFKSKFDNKKFDFIVGNPPFGGTIEPAIQDELDNKYGNRDGLKIKKETYSFFIVACVEMLAKKGQLKFICSDSFLTIPTMKGLREFLLNRGKTKINKLEEFSDETNQPMVIIDFTLDKKSNHVIVNDKRLNRKVIDLTGNKSWQIANEFIPLFSGKKIGDFMVASSGMTIGCNELFLREIDDNKIHEHLSFEFFKDPITMENEKSRARLGKLSKNRVEEITRLEKSGATKRNVKVIPLNKEKTVRIPHPDYKFYNKASSDIVYAQPKNAIFWKNNGDAVLTFKKNGNWYLRGVGGKPFFEKEGLSWQLVSQSLNMRYLPAGYILDSGAPCAFLRDGVDQDELWFILGWSLTSLCTRVLKEVLNHTRNIQSKDFEKLPYPFWVDEENKKNAIQYIHEIVQRSIKGRKFNRSDQEINKLNEIYNYKVK